LIFELGRFLTRVGGAEKEATRYFEEALRLDPKHAPSLAALGRFEEAIAADPNDAAVHLTYAEWLLGNALGDFAGIFQAGVEHEESFRKARELAFHALSLGTDEARARGVIGVSHLVEEDLASGIAELERAHALAPARADYAIHLYAMYLLRGERSKADVVYKDLVERARDPQVGFAARNVRLRIETDRANALAKAGDLEAAAAIIREISASVEDGPARTELERHADQLTALGVVNRHIAMYNRAVGLSNKGRTREAAAVLDELLAVATDPGVVKDAKSLRKSLKAR
jgi:tetratricopeptide (TPR) repeat protein